VGLIPETELLREAGGQLNGDLPRVNGALRSNLPWLFVAGNARKVHRFVDTVMDDGSLAGANAAAYVQKEA
jgi:thioredoxin reductase